MKYLLPLAVWLAVIVFTLRLLARRERHVERADRLAGHPSQNAGVHPQHDFPRALPPHRFYSIPGDDQ